MNRSYQLQFCRACKNKSFSTEEGVICGLTQRPAAFEKTCEHYIEDENAVKKVSAANYNNETYSILKNRLSAYFFTLFGSLVLIPIIVLLGQSDLSIGILVLSGILMLISSALVLAILYKLWEYVIEEYTVQGIEPPVESAGQAIGYLFIPVFNFYWIFIAYGKLSVCLNELAKTRKSQINLGENFGFIIGVLTLLAIIPYAGILIGLVAALVLMPVFLTKTINSLQAIPDYSGSVGKGFKESEKVNFRDIRDFTQLFKTDGQGFNFKLGFLYIIASMLTKLLFHLVSNGFSFSMYKEFYFYANILLDGVFIFAIILISGSVSKIALVFLSAIFYFITAVGSMAVFFWNYKEASLGSFWEIMNWSNILVYLLFGMVFIASLYFVVIKWGVNIFGIISAMIFTSLFMQFLWTVSHIIQSGDFTLHFKSIIYSVIQGLMVGMAIYLSSIWHMGSSENKYTDNSKEMLDYNIE